MKVNTIIELLTPKAKLYSNPSTAELVNNSLNLKYSLDVIHSILNK
jgi:hypothetical protein